MEIIKRLNRELVYKGTVINMYRDTVQGGAFIGQQFFRKGAAAVVPVLDDGRVLMVKQYRNALDRMTIEVPAGGRDTTDEPYITCASRELEEETGYKSDNLEFLISVQTTVAFCNEKIDVFVARNLKKTHQHLDEDECVEVEAYDVDELIDMIYAGKLQDGKTMAAIMAYKLKYAK
mgnify:CR=1 FL=1